jgi:hypothetical protein
MISSAIVQSAIVLMNRKMKAERDVMMFIPVCSRMMGMQLHHSQGTNRAQAKMSRGFSLCVRYSFSHRKTAPNRIATPPHDSAHVSIAEARSQRVGFTAA